MDADTTSACGKQVKDRYKQRTDIEKKNFLNNKDKKSTQQATEGYLNRFIGYLQLKQHPKLEDLEAKELNVILSDYYSAVQPRTKDGYCVQTMKCMRAGINRHMRKTKGFDICKDTDFIKANEMFKAVCVEAKRNGLGVKRSTPKISQIDLERIQEYFSYDHMNLPDPRRLQQAVIFYIIYYFCRRGRENLYCMTQDTFKVHVNPDGSEYIIQNLDEMDKNHGPEDTEKNNDGRIYPTNGNNKHFCCQIKISRQFNT